MKYEYKKCHICGKEFFNIEGRSFSNHIKWDHSGEKKLNNCKEIISEKAIERLEKKFGVKTEINRKCPVCNKEYKTLIKIKQGKQIPFSFKNGKEKWYKNKYCSISCSNKDRQKTIWTKEQKLRASIRTKKLWDDEEYRKKQFEIQENSKIFSSKREIEIRNYFIEKFPNDNWTFGYLGKVNGEIISADLYSNKLKIIFEYDGIWHFKDIKRQLKKKIYKDFLEELFAINNNYKLVRIDEEKNLNFNEIEKLIYKEDERIIKIGNRY